MAEPSDPLQQILRREGPLTSQAFSDALLKSGLVANHAAARKSIERAHSAKRIKSTNPVRFDKSFLYFLEAHKGRQYARAIRKLLPSKPAFSRVFKVILASKGWITRGQIGKAAGCLPPHSTSGAGGRQPLEVVVQQLLALALIEEVAGEAELFRIGTQFGSTSVKRVAFRKKIELEHRLLTMFRDWVRNCYLIAYESHEVRESETSATAFNDTLWDLRGPIYFGPFSHSKGVQSLWCA